MYSVILLNIILAMILCIEFIGKNIAFDLFVIHSLLFHTQRIFQDQDSSCLTRWTTIFDTKQDSRPVYCVWRIQQYWSGFSTKKCEGKRLFIGYIHYSFVFKIKMPWKCHHNFIEYKLDRYSLKDSSRLIEKKYVELLRVKPDGEKSVWNYCGSQ